MADVRLSDINLNLLVALDALLSECSVTRAAGRAGVSQSAMSHALGNLRALLGDELLVRGKRGMVLTPKAEQLGGPLRRGLQDLQRALRGESGFDARTAQRTFTVAMKDNIALLFVPRLLARLGREAPGVNLRVRPCDAHAQAELLESGAVDLALEVHASSETAGLLRRRLFTEGFACLVRADHPDVKKRLDLDTFVRLGHALISPEGDGPGTVDVALAQRGLSRRVALRVPWVLATPMIVASSDLVATVPRCVAETFARGFGLQLFEPPLELPTFDIGQVWHQRYDQDAAHRWLRGLMVDAASEIVAQLTARRRRPRLAAG